MSRLTQVVGGGGGGGKVDNTDSVSRVRIDAGDAIALNSSWYNRAGDGKPLSVPGNMTHKAFFPCRPHKTIT